MLATLEEILGAVSDLEHLQAQKLKMVIEKVKLATPQGQPALQLASNLDALCTVATSSTVQFDPALVDAARWQLRSVDGRDPTAAELSTHQKRYAGRSQKLPMEQLPPVSRMIPRETILLIDDAEPGYKLAAFRPNLTLPIVGDVAKKLTGRIWYHEQGGFIERVVVQNEGKLTPIPGLTIQSLHVSMRFAQVELESGSGVLQPIMIESELLLLGKKLFKSFEQVSFHRYSEHAPIA